jgi:hypothetical protein
MLSVLAMTVCGMTSYGQSEEAEVPGDHFSLEGALDLFKRSESPEEFEKLLNSPDSKVNNLDLNGDGYIDYIRVFDRQEKNVHVFILQAVVSDNESQDIAVIELEKLANGKAVLQIVGDEDIYGVQTIIEPTREVRTYAGTTASTTVVNVWAWPSVQYVYGPYYRPWYSPWGWHAYPVWWRTWRPVAYVHYYPIYVAYRPYYSYCHTRRVAYAHHIYHPYRTTSVVVHHRHGDQITRYRNSAHSRRDYANNSRSDRNNNGRGFNGSSNGRQGKDQLNSGRDAQRDVRNSDFRSDRTKSVRSSDIDRQKVRTNDGISQNRTTSTQERTINRQPVRKNDGAVEVSRNSPVRKQDFENRSTTTSGRESNPRSNVETQRRTTPMPERQTRTSPQSNSRSQSPSIRNTETREVNRGGASMERRSPSVERSSPAIERRSPSTERRSPSIERSSAPTQREAGSQRQQRPEGGRQSRSR